MVDQDEVQGRVRRQIAEARERIGSVDEGPRRWNRVEEAMEAVCEEAVGLLDNIGRYDQANSIQSHMAAHERFDLLLRLFQDEAGALERESAEAGLSDEFAFCRALLPAMNDLAEPERRHRPGA